MNLPDLNYSDPTNFALLVIVCFAAVVVVVLLVRWVFALVESWVSKNRPQEEEDITPKDPNAPPF